MRGYIYKITSKVNNKIYIGQTIRPIKERFSEHLRSADGKYNNQPLYDAMNKYGKDNFVIELIGEYDYEELNEYESLFIEQYDSYNSGYNATLGGEGRPVHNYEELANEFITSGLSISKYAENNFIRESTVRTALEIAGLTETYRDLFPEYNTRFNPKPVCMLDKKTRGFIRSFNSVHQALKYLNKENDRGHIREVCNGKRKSAYGYKWKYA